MLLARLESEVLRGSDRLASGDARLNWRGLLFTEARKPHTYSSAAETARYGGTVVQLGGTNQVASRAECRVAPRRLVHRRIDGYRCRGNVHGQVAMEHQVYVVRNSRATE